MTEIRQYQSCILLVICFFVMHECFFDPIEERDPIVFHFRVVPQEFANRKKFKFTTTENERRMKIKTGTYSINKVIVSGSMEMSLR